MQTVVETPEYLRTASPIFTEAERELVVAEIAANPESGALMPGTGGYRKLRFGRAGMGKRGGARVIYLYKNRDYPAFLIMAYAKNEMGAPTKEQQNRMAKAAQEVFAGYGGKA